VSPAISDYRLCGTPDGRPNRTAVMPSLNRARKCTSGVMVFCTFVPTRSGASQSTKRPELHFRGLLTVGSANHLELMRT
jgi:hypothetical protein